MAKCIRYTQEFKRDALAQVVDRTYSGFSLKILMSFQG